MKRLVETITGPKGTVRIYYESHSKEYLCIYRKSPESQGNTYYTDDKQDAITTAKFMTGAE